jgi:stage II sporulation protein E
MKIKTQNIKMENILSDYSRIKLQSLAKTYEELSKLYIEELKTTKDTGRDRKDLFYINELSTARKVFAEQLQNISESFGEIADTQVRVSAPLEHKRKALISYLKKQGILVREIVFIGNDKIADKITIEAKTIGRGFVSAAMLGTLLSSFFGRNLVTSRGSALSLYRGYDIFIYEEEPRFNLLSSVSRAVKDSEKISGDNFSLDEYNLKDAVLMISDGMGSGKKANHDSMKVIEFMERLLEAGFDKERAFSMVSSAVVSLSEEFGLTGLDVCGVDLINGEVEFIKAGAAPSFLKRGRKVEVFACDNLPLGSSDRICPFTQTTRLTQGDMLIMVSDGVTDALDINKLANLISKSNVTSPRELSDKILSNAINAGNGHIRDDMTVITASLSANHTN